MNMLKMQSPWVSHYEKIRELFRYDSEIKVTWDEDSNTVTLYIDNPNKARALRTFIPEHKNFGSVVMNINIVPSNSRKMADSLEDKSEIEYALEGNLLYHFTRIFQEAFMSKPLTYVVMAKEVVQYYNDDLGDLYGNANCLPEDLAKDVFENTQGIFFSTDIK